LTAEVASRLRLEYPGALCHVINRGNFRRDQFKTAEAAQSFVEALEEGVRRHGWQLHAYQALPMEDTAVMGHLMSCR